jgi:hypothetical protein
MRVTVPAHSGCQPEITVSMNRSAGKKPAGNAVMIPSVFSLIYKVLL